VQVDASRVNIRRIRVGRAPETHERIGPGSREPGAIDRRGVETTAMHRLRARSPARGEAQGRIASSVWEVRTIDGSEARKPNR